jgi:hypothetical protein
MTILPLLSAPCQLRVTSLPMEYHIDQKVKGKSKNAKIQSAYNSYHIAPGNRLVSGSNYCLCPSSSM